MEKKNNTRVEFRKGVKIAFADKAAWTEKDLEKARKIMSNNPDKINGLSDNAWENILHYMACCHFLSVKNCCLERILQDYGVGFMGINDDPGVDIHSMLMPFRKLTNPELCIFYKALRKYKGAVLKRFTDENTRENLNGKEKSRFDSLTSSWLIMGEGYPCM